LDRNPANAAVLASIYPNVAAAFEQPPQMEVSGATVPEPSTLMVAAFVALGAVAQRCGRAATAGAASSAWPPGRHFLPKSMNW
jgi:PEP-CTERM motif-containing protein